MGKTIKKIRLGFLQRFTSMRLVHKLMLVYSVVLAGAIIAFASQLINVANNSTELNLINDTQKLLKETKYSIEREIDICYRAINSLSSDYDFVSYLKDWDKSDKTNIFDFNMDLYKKVQQIRNLSPDIYQLRIFIINPNFPEIGSIIYSDTRLTDKDTILEEASQNPNGYWQLDHTEECYNTGTLERKKVVSLFVPLWYSKHRELGIIEVSILTKTFFRHMFSQSENENLLAFVVDNNGNVIYDNDSEFALKYGLDIENIKDLYKGQDIKGKSGKLRVDRERISMSLIYDYIDKIGCSICYVVTNESITANLRNTRNLIIAESLLAMVILCILIYFFTNILLIKMKLIITSMRKVEDGNLDIRVDISGQDEMSELAYHFNRMLGKIGDLISEVVKKQEAKKNAEIRALFTQINSHFIINTLETISMMAEIEYKYEVADAITSLGKLLRYSMKWSKEYVLLKAEIEYIENYMILMNIRYDYETRLDIQIPEELTEYKVLKMLLQPIVENAIQYGIGPLGQGGKITIRSYSQDEYTILEVIDDGAGMDEERLKDVQQSILLNIPLENQEEKGTGIGLRNVNERIKLFFGENYGVDIVSEKGSYTKVIIKLPAAW